MKEKIYVTYREESDIWELHDPNTNKSYFLLLNELMNEITLKTNEDLICNQCGNGLKEGDIIQISKEATVLENGDYEPDPDNFVIKCEVCFNGSE